MGSPEEMRCSGSSGPMMRLYSSNAAAAFINSLYEAPIGTSRYAQGLLGMLRVSTLDAADPVS